MTIVAISSNSAPKGFPLDRQATTLIVVEHDMQFIKEIANKVTVFHQGSILIEDSVEAVMNNSVVRDIYLGKENS